MKILAPFISCLIEASDETIDNITPLQRALNEGYSQVYMTTSEGYFKYHSLNPGANGKPRFICLPVKEIPGVILPKATPGVQFLPDGKIPMELFDEIKEFFSQVISKKGKALEAMIWVLWNQTNGYFLHVPNQTVGHASAHYDWGSLPSGSSIVVDIHSHADFGAFFSATDDRDDSGCIRYSGVIGHNDKPERSMKFRFNYLGNRMEVQLTDLFERKQGKVLIPDSWMDNVKLNVPSPAVYKGAYTGHSYFPNGRPSMSGPIHGQGYSRGSAVEGAGSDEGYHGYVPPAARRQQAQGASKAVAGGIADSEQEDESFPVETKKQRKQRERAQANQARAQQERRSQNTGPRQLDLVTGMSESSKVEGTNDNQGNQGNQGNTDEKGGPLNGERFLDSSGRLVQIGNGSLNSRLKGNIVDGYYSDEDEAFLDKQVEEYFRHLSETSGIHPQGGVDPVGASGYEEFVSEGNLPPDFDAIAINHGIQVARAYTLIDNASTDLIHAPEVMQRCVGDMFLLLSDDVKLKTLREMADYLSPRDRDNLATNGL
jgi:hypothetical protein